MTMRRLPTMQHHCSSVRWGSSVPPYPVGQLLVCHERLGAGLCLAIAGPHSFPRHVFVIAIFVAGNHAGKKVNLQVKL